MNLSVGSTGALLAMIVIALWLWRGGQRPIRSTALNVALIAMIAAVAFESAWPSMAIKLVGQGGLRDEGCWLWLMLAVNAAVHAVALGAFVRFVVTTIAQAGAKSDIKE